MNDRKGSPRASTEEDPHRRCDIGNPRCAKHRPGLPTRDHPAKAEPARHPLIRPCQALAVRCAGTLCNRTGTIIADSRRRCPESTSALSRCEMPRPTQNLAFCVRAWTAAWRTIELSSPSRAVSADIDAAAASSACPSASSAPLPSSAPQALAARQRPSAWRAGARKPRGQRHTFLQEGAACATKGHPRCIHPLTTGRGQIACAAELIVLRRLDIPSPRNICERSRTPETCHRPTCAATPCVRALRERPWEKQRAMLRFALWLLRHVFGSATEPKADGTFVPTRPCARARLAPQQLQP